jgi:NUC153 domain
MTEPLLKKHKVKGDDGSPNAHSVMQDPRFSNIQSDPRYRLPTKRRAHVKVDKRFSHMLRDDDFSRKAKVDRYGRLLEDDSERKRLRRRYEFEDPIDNDEEVQKELHRIEKASDPMRNGGYSGTSSSEDSSSEDDEAGEDIGEQFRTLGNQEDGVIPMGHVSSRIAVVNLDWDNIRAIDLLAVFSSFLVSGGRLLKVSIYPSEFGKEFMEREETEGPPKEIFAPNKEKAADAVASDDDDEQQIRDSIVKADTGEDFDSAALRRYQLQRLQYFYAVLVFSSTSVARAVYDAIDGTEYLATANFFDLRFIPDGTDFSEDKVRDECEKIPDGYKPNEFVTDALQHSNVKLTWDAEDTSRKEVQARAFRGSRKDIDENDLKAYLGSDSSSDEQHPLESQTAVGINLSKRDRERQKMRSLLGLEVEPKKKGPLDDAPVGGLQITFSSGLSGVKGTRDSVFENETEIEETTVERYVRRERERKQKRKEKMKNPRDGVPSMSTDGRTALEKSANEPSQDLGFDDPFFASPENDQTSASKMRKEERSKKRAEREVEETTAAARRAELELLMVDDKDDGRGVRHFNMNEIEREEKRAKKRGKKDRSKTEAATETESQKTNFKMDTHDPRFARLYENPEFAIDPTNPKFKGTKGMNALLQEGRRHKQDGDVEQQEAPSTQRSMSDNENNDVRKLIEKVKSKKVDGT